MQLHKSLVLTSVGGARSWRLCGLLAGVAAAVALAASSAQAHTIQLIATGTTVGATSTTYHYELESTPNNGLTNNSTWESGTVVLDFPGFISASLTHNAGGEVTASSDWSLSTTLTGAGSMPNANYNITTAGETTIFGSVAGDKIQATDSATAMNVVVLYTGAGVSFAHSSQLTLIGLDIVAASGLTSSTVVETIGRDSTAAAIGQTESFPAPVVTPSTIPLPAALPAGFSTLAGLAVLYLVRRRR